MKTSGDPQTEPRYVEIGRNLREQIRRGDLAAGQRLVGERQLAREFGVSPVTMGRALADLARDGVLVRVPGVGTFVADGEAQRVSAVDRARRTFEILVDTSPIDQPLANHYMGPVMGGLQEAAAEHGCAVRFLDQGRTTGPTAAEISEGQGVLYLAPLACRRAEVEELARSAPVVACGVRWPGSLVSTVDSDNVGAAAQVVDYLTRLGHTRILLLTSPAQRTDTVDRIVGFRQALVDHGIDPCNDLFLEADQQEGIGETALGRLDVLMCGRDAPTALFATDYALALESMARLRSLGLHIPNDVSVVGFDDPISAAYLSPPLTTVRQPLREMGRRAAEMLLDLIEHGTQACPTHVFPCTLVVRGSCRSTRHAA
jgi:DNA-binding LacI/PurR family transcriptional regulator